MSPGDGVESQSLQESPKKSSSIVIPEDFESQKEMVRRVINPQKILVFLCFVFIKHIKAERKLKVDIYLIHPVLCQRE